VLFRGFSAIIGLVRIRGSTAVVEGVRGAVGMGSARRAGAPRAAYCIFPAFKILSITTLMRSCKYLPICTFKTEEIISMEPSRRLQQILQYCL
jgi:hypothetical protein